MYINIYVVNTSYVNIFLGTYICEVTTVTHRRHAVTEHVQLCEAIVQSDIAW